MPAGVSHLAIHFRDDRRREADPRRAARATLASVTAPIAWTALTGAIGYGALITSHVMPIRQFGAILGTCTFGAAMLVMLISPIAMLPPFRMEIPVRYGSRSPVTGVMNRLVLWVYRRPLSIVVTVLAIVLPVALGLIRLSYETNYNNFPMPETRVVGDYHKVEARLGGIGLVELVVPLGSSITGHTLDELKAVEDRIQGIRVTNPQGVAGVLSLATVLDPDRRLAALSPDRRNQIIADKLELIAASPQNELLPSFWNAETGDSRLMIRMMEQQPAPDKNKIFRIATDAAAERFGPKVYLTGLSLLMTRTTEAIIATQWGTFLWSAIGILIMLTLAFRKLVRWPSSPFIADAAPFPSMSRPQGLMGWLKIQLDMATALVASVALRALGRRHVSLPSAIPPGCQDRAVSQAAVQ